MMLRLAGKPAAAVTEGVLVLSLVCLACTAAETKSKKEHQPMAIKLTSAAFEEGKPIPAKHTCEGADVSPPLKWSDAPPGTKSFALICDDPDAPVGTWVHWVIYGLPASTSELVEKIPASETLPSGANQGLNNFKRVGYGGPCPPPGNTHRYYFKLYALDTELSLKPRATKKELLKAMEGHILAEGSLMGTCQRQR